MPNDDIILEVTETRTRIVAVPLDKLPGYLRDELGDGIVSDLRMSHRGNLALVAGHLADHALVPVSLDRIERHVEQRFLP